MKTINLIFLLALSLSWVACSSDDDNSSEILPVDTTPKKLVLSNTTFPASGEASMLTIQLRSNEAWKVEKNTDADWVTVTPSEGNSKDSVVNIKIQLSRNLNSDADYRRTILTFRQTTNDTVSEEFSITQYTDYNLMQDSLVLLELYEALGGENWRVSWDLNTSMYGWAGIGIDKIDGKNRVISFAFPNANSNGGGPDLSANNIVGQLPDCLGKLTGLRFLGFDNEPGLRGELPASLKNTKIEHIEIVGCPNFGNLLSLSLQECKTLQFLTLASCNYTGYEEGWTGDLPALRTLVISGNHFSGELKRTLISDMQKLVLFEARNNDFSGSLPAGLFSGKDMMAFALSGNRFTGDFPTSISALSAYKNSSPQVDVCPQQPEYGFTEGTCYAVEE